MTKNFNSFRNSVRLGFFIAIRQILRTSKWTTGLIVFIMMLTFLNLVATSGFLVGIVEGSSREFKNQWTGDLMITNLNDKQYIEHSDDIFSVLSSFPQIDKVTGRLIASAKYEANWWKKTKEDDANIVNNQLAGIDPIKEDAAMHLSDAIVEGTWLQPDDTKGIIIGSNFLKEYSIVSDLLPLLYDIHPGTVIKVTVSSKKADLSSITNPFLKKDEDNTSVTQEFIVRGIIKSKVDFVSNRAYILDSELRKMVGKSDGDMSEIAVVMKKGVDPYYVKTPLMSNGFGNYAKINTADEGAPAFLVNIKLFFNIIGTVLGSVSVVVALVTIFIIIYINALTRRRQIGIMKGIGVSPFAIEFSYICQAMFYVLIGSVIALLIIFGLLKPVLDAHPIDTPFASIVLVASAYSVFIKFILVVSVSVMAGYLPARLIVKKNTLDAILGRNN